MVTFAWLLEGCGYSEKLLKDPHGPIHPSALEHGQAEPMKPRTGPPRIWDRRPYS